MARKYKLLSNSKMSRVKRHILGLPEPDFGSGYGLVGTQTHKILLEKESLSKEELVDLTTADEVAIEDMVNSVRSHEEASDIINCTGVQVEVELKGNVYGVASRGFLDILNLDKSYIADLKTTSTYSYQAFLNSAIKYGYFRQAHFYQKLSGIDQFYFIGVQKKPPFSVFILDVIKYPREMWKAIQETKFLTHYYKNHYPDVFESPTDEV